MRYTRGGGSSGASMACWLSEPREKAQRHLRGPDRCGPQEEINNSEPQNQKDIEHLDGEADLGKTHHLMMRTISAKVNK